MTAPRDEDLYRTIEEEARDEVERNDSKVIYQALKQHRQKIDGASALPEDDRQLSEKIHAAAKVRSRELSAPSPRVSGRLPVEGEPVSSTLWILWVVAIIAAALILYFAW